DGDADQNGVVDGLDLAVWQQQFGPSTAPAVSAVTVEIAASAVDDSLFAASAPLLALASPFAGASEEVFVAASTDRSLTLMIADESPRAAAERPGPIADHVAVQVGRSARKSLADASDRDEAFSHWDHAASQLANEIAEFGGLHPSSRGPSRSRRH
ncbi:MAG: hypothetical protein KDA44_01370, partial [Planctomycetales bacterium]|nr:hypothetical protein [Planctomycetales bacterium]